MALRRLLVSWVGHADLLAMAHDLPASRRDKLLHALNVRPTAGYKEGPIRSLLDHETFQQVHLLSNYEPFLAKWFSQWLQVEVQIHGVKVSDPTDYPSVFRAADSVLREITEHEQNGQTELCIHLSPGTPAMTAIWVLLGKSRYPATFYQTHDGRAWETEIPFDLAVDFVPEFLQSPDLGLSALAARSPQEIPGFSQIAGNSKAIRLAVGRAQKAAVRDVPVLILGETGTGKELFARAIHEASHRKSGPFVAINCAAIPRELLECELFGHKKGAFTGAAQDRPGAFDQADEGTLFLDEVGECGPEMQSKLLRALQPPPDKGPCYRVFRRLGETKDRACDVRLITATNLDLLAAIEAHRFREDLYYRLAVITLNLPPLRDRKTDMAALVTSLLERINEDFRRQEPGYQDKSVSDAAISFVRRYPWPGNVRQLHNALVQAAVMTDRQVIQPADLRAAVAEMPPGANLDPLEHPLGDGFSLDDHLQAIQRHYIERAMHEADGVKTHAARLLGIASYQTLDAQLKRLGIQWKS